MGCIVSHVYVRLSLISYTHTHTTHTYTGNAADAAIATAAMLCLTEPCSTGIGGDMVCLYYDVSQERVHAINGAGRSPSRLTLDHVMGTKQFEGMSELPWHSALSVTVPGSVKAWDTLREKFGSLPMATLLAPTVRAAERGSVECLCVLPPVCFSCCLSHLITDTLSPP